MLWPFKDTLYQAQVTHAASTPACLRISISLTNAVACAQARNGLLPLQAQQQLAAAAARQPPAPQPPSESLRRKRQLPLS